MMRALAILCFLAMGAFAEDFKLAHGVVVQGELVQVKEEGLEIKTAQGNKVLAWKMLSAGTRFRYQESYRAQFTNILAGASVRTSAK